MRMADSVENLPVQIPLPATLAPVRRRRLDDNPAGIDATSLLNTDPALASTRTVRFPSWISAHLLACLFPWLLFA